MLKLFPLFSPFSFSFALAPPTLPLCDPDPSACMTTFSGAFAGSSDRATSAAALTKDAAAATPAPAKVAAAAPTNARDLAQHRHPATAVARDHRGRAADAASAAAVTMVAAAEGRKRRIARDRGGLAAA